MKKKTKKVFKPFLPSEYKAIEKYLDEMAIKGYVLNKKNDYWFTFIKTEPIKLEFNISVLCKGSAKDYRELCIESGWIYCCSDKMFQIFCKEKNKEVVPIHTDLEEEYKLIRNAIIRLDIIFLILALCYSYTMTMKFNRFFLMNSIQPRYEDYLYILLESIMILIFGIISYTDLKWLIINKQRISSKKELFNYNMKKVNNRVKLHKFLFALLISTLSFQYYTLFRNDFITINALIITVLIIFLSSFIYWCYTSRFRIFTRSKLSVNTSFYITLILIFVSYLLIISCFRLL